MVCSCPSCRTKQLLFVSFPFATCFLKSQFPVPPGTSPLRVFPLDTPELARTYMQGRRLHVGFEARRFPLERSRCLLRSLSSIAFPFRVPFASSVVAVGLSLSIHPSLLIVVVRRASCEALSFWP